MIFHISSPEMRTCQKQNTSTKRHQQKFIENTVSIQFHPTKKKRFLCMENPIFLFSGIAANTFSKLKPIGTVPF